MATSIKDLYKEECLERKRTQGDVTWREGSKQSKNDPNKRTMQGVCVEKKKVYPYTRDSIAHQIRSKAFKMYNEDVRRMANKIAIEKPEAYIEVYGRKAIDNVATINEKFGGLVCGAVKMDQKNPWSTEQVKMCRSYSSATRGGKKVPMRDASGNVVRDPESGKIKLVTKIFGLPQSGTFVTLANRLSRAVNEGRITFEEANKMLDRVHLTTPPSAKGELGPRSPSEMIGLLERQAKLMPKKTRAK